MLLFLPQLKVVDTTSVDFQQTLALADDFHFGVGPFSRFKSGVGPAVAGCVCHQFRDDLKLRLGSQFLAKRENELFFQVTVRMPSQTLQCVCQSRVLQKRTMSI